MIRQTYSQAYTFDRYGNKTQSANSTLGLPAVASTDYDTTNHNNRFVSGVATYDNGGNITTDSKFRNLTYAYDANNRQTSASNGTWTESQTYDCAGQRVQTSVSGVGSTTYRTMVYDIFGQDVADYTGSTGGTLERENIYRGGLLATYEAGTSSLKYVLQDAQASTRAIMNNSGSSSSVIARHDFLPFGEEIGANIGLRTSGQGYGATDTSRQKYGLTERDDTSGLDHTWFRKYENLSGRWTSPDPYGGSMSTANPQSFNRYNYVQNDPLSSMDPSGLDGPGFTWHIDPATGWMTAVPDISSSAGDISSDPNLMFLFSGGFSGGEMGLLQFKLNVLPAMFGKGDSAFPEPANPAQNPLCRRLVLFEAAVKEALDNFQRSYAEEVDSSWLRDPTPTKDDLGKAFVGAVIGAIVFKNPLGAVAGVAISLIGSAIYIEGQNMIDPRNYESNQRMQHDYQILTKKTKDVVREMRITRDEVNMWWKFRNSGGNCGAVGGTW